MDALWERNDGSRWRTIQIPSNDDFLKQYHQWTFKKVADRFRRDKDRIEDTVQNVRVRLLQKDFIGRWFFKHLTHELVDRSQAERILGRDTKLKFISAVQPVVGQRSDSDSLWRISDLLDYAKFDHERYFYSIQNHTIDSDTVLRLIGYPPGSYNVLKSLYKQGRIKPAELTQHECSEVVLSGKSVNGKCSIPDCDKKHFSRGFCTTHYGRRVTAECPICEKGRASLHSRGVSLADDWMQAVDAVSSIRWLDSQFRPFLRQWRGQNLVSTTPLRIVRPDGYSGHQGIEAGLLKYAWIIINNEVVNDFKRIARTFDASNITFNKGVSSGIGDANLIAWELGDNGEPQIVVKDSSSLNAFISAENDSDVETMIDKANLSNEERVVITAIDLQETNVREYAESVGVSIAHAHRVRNSALEKMRRVDTVRVVPTMEEVCSRYGCSVEEMLGPSKVGPCVRARAEFFYGLHKIGMSIDEISTKVGVSRERVALAVGRAQAREKFLSPSASSDVASEFEEASSSEENDD